jgi:collagen type VII alpha
MTVSLQEILQNNLPLGWTGSQGYTGSIGYVGSYGPIGFTGSVGPMGPPGLYAGLGYVGSAGIDGFVGSEGAGFTGSLGARGYTGSKGIPGEFAALGYTGSSAPGFSGSTGGFNSLQGINLQTGTNYSFVFEDAGKLVKFYNTATITVTIPPESQVPFSIGQRIDVAQDGPANVFFQPGLGVILDLAADINYLNLQNTGGTLVKVASNEWMFVGPAPAGYTGSQGVGYSGSLGTRGYAGSLGGLDSIQPINLQTGTFYSFVSSDAGKLVEFSNIAPITATIPPDSEFNFFIGQRIDVAQLQNGSVFFQGGLGVNLLYADVNYLNLAKTAGSLIKTGVNEWFFIGPSPTGYTGSVGSGYTGSFGTAGYAGSLGGLSSIQTINFQTGTNYTFVSADAGKLVEFNNTSSVTVTIPDDLNLPFFVGQRIDVFQAGRGTVFFQPALNVTLITPDVNYLNVQNVGGSLIKTGANEWTFIGPSPTGYTGSLGFGYTGSIGNIGYAGSLGGLNSIQTINIITATNYSFVTSDAGKLLEFNNIAPITVTIPNDSNLPFFVGQRIDLLQSGDGQVFFQPGVGVTFVTPDVNYLNVKNVGASIIKTDANEWTFIGPSPTGYTGSIGIGFVGSLGPSGFVGSLGGLSSIQTINFQTGTNYSFVSSDAGKLVEFVNTATITATIPPDSQFNFFVGQRIDVFQGGPGAVFFQPGVGVTFITPDVNYLNVQNVGGTLIKTGVNEWTFIGPSPTGYTGSVGSGYTGSIGIIGYAGSLGGLSSIQSIKLSTATNYTIVTSDAGKLIEFNNISPITVSIPNDLDLSFFVGQRIDVLQGGDGIVFFQPALNVTLVTPDVNYLNVKNVAASLIKTDVNEWTFIGPSPSGYTGSTGAGFTGSLGNIGFAGSLGGLSSIQTINVVTGTNYSFVSADAGKLVEFINIATVTATIPPDSQFNFFVGQRIDVFQGGPGAVFFQPGAGVTFITPDVNYLNVQNVGGSLIKTGANEWTFIGPSPTGYTGSQGAGFTGSIGIIGYAGSLGGLSSIQTINVQTGTNYVFTSADAGRLVRFANTATVITATIPSDNDLPNFFIGQRIDVFLGSTSTLFFQGGLGVTLITPDVNYINVANVGGSLIKTNVNEWTFIGPSPSGYTGSTGAGFTGSIGIIGYAGSLGGLSSIQTINVVTGTNYSFVAADAGKLVRFVNTASITATIPSDNDLPNFFIGQRIDLFLSSTSTVFFQPGVGVTFITPDVNYLNVANVGASLIKTNANEWTFIGPSPSGYTGSQGAGFTGSIGIIGYAGSVGGLSSIQTINIQTGTNYSFVSADAGKLVEFINTATITVTIPSDNDLPFFVGQRIDVFQGGAGTVFFQPGAGVTFVTPDVNYLNVQNVGGSLIKTGANEWTFIGPSPTGYTGSRGAGFTGSLGNSGFVGSLGGLSSIQTINIQTGTSYSFVTADAGKLVEFSNLGTVTVTIPPDSDLPFFVGQRIDVLQVNTGPVFFQPGVGVTLQTIGGAADVNFLNLLNAAGSLIKTGINEWTFIGPAPTGYVGSLGYTGSQGERGFIGFTGSRGYTGSQGVGFTGSQSYTGSSGFMGSTGEKGFTGSVGTVLMERHFNYPGTISAGVGTARWWSQQSLVISRIKAQLTTPPIGGDINIGFKKNGVTVQSLAVPAGSINSAINTVNITTVDGDYLTVDIVSVGSVSAGTDLVISFLFVRNS